MENNRSAIYIIPSFLHTGNTQIFSESFIRTVCQIHYFFVENERSARRFLKALNKSTDIDKIRFSPVNNQEKADLNVLRLWLKEGRDIGIISEAGYPCIADPGNIIVKEAHKLKVKIVPLAGPNAMLMALASSGMNGQRFSFSGYIPVKNPERLRAIKDLEKKMIQSGETQIFMETPYRNDTLLKDILLSCQPQTLLCIAADITAPTQLIETKTIREWKLDPPSLNKRPAVFLFGK